MGFSSERLLESLTRFSWPRRYRVALSGGLDSVVLLHALATLRERLGVPVDALHVHHGLHPDAGRWQLFCERLGRDLGVGVQTLRVDVASGSGESPEAAAREARYRALATLLSEGDVLLSAQHRDDQAETVLLQLLRGSGPSGLAAMPAEAPLGAGRLVRPLLGFGRAELQAYAREQGLAWIEDPSNEDTRFDRNFLRREVIPLLRRRWPALDRTLSRSAAHCAEAQALIDSLADADLAQAARSDGGLELAAVERLAPPGARALLRRWIRSRGQRVPDSARLDLVLREVVGAASDRNPRVHWSGVEIRRYRGVLYLETARDAPRVTEGLEWDGHCPLVLPGGGALHAARGVAGVDAGLWAKEPLRVRFRVGGERCRPRGRRHSQTLKRLLQEIGVPPWVRARVPLVYAGQRLVAVADLWVCEPFHAEAPLGVGLRWER